MWSGVPSRRARRAVGPSGRRAVGLLVSEREVLSGFAEQWNATNWPEPEHTSSRGFGWTHFSGPTGQTLRARFTHVDPWRKRTLDYLTEKIPFEWAGLRVRLSNAQMESSMIQ